MSWLGTQNYHINEHVTTLQQRECDNVWKHGSRVWVGLFRAHGIVTDMVFNI